MKERQCYEILGITKRATDEELRSAYRTKCKQWHPDMQQGNAVAAHKFSEIVDAYKTITEIREEQRKAKAERRIFKRPTTAEVSEKKQKAEKAEKTVQNTKRGKNLYYILDLTFEEACLGCNKTIKIYKLVQCSCSKEERASCNMCKGIGAYKKMSVYEVTIPSGVYNEQCIKLTGQGNEGTEKGNNGDLILKMHVLPSEEFKRERLDIYSDLIITYPEAVLGAIKTVNTIRGLVEVDIPKGFEAEKVICLRGRGVIDKDTGEMGNQYIKVHIDIPKVLDSNQENLIRTLQKSFVYSEYDDVSSADVSNDNVTKYASSG